MLSSILFSSPIVTSITGASCIMSGAAYLLYYLHQLQQLSTAETPVSVNYHFSRKCNYECGFCFHTEKTSSILSLDEAKRGMKLLKEAGMKKLNFAGGEPFLYPVFMRELLRYGKGELGIESISIVSNGSKITEKFLRENAAFIDILAISCDSFDPETNIKIGRGRSGENVEQLTKVAGWCQQFGIKFKVNTVVCSLNWDEDMTRPITQFQPFRWKVFQCLIVTGENDNEQRKRDARSFLVSDEQWRAFCDRHKLLKCFVPESNEMMKGSYLILDENMRFLDKGDGEEKASESILDVGVRKAMTQVRWERNAFVERGGFYDWTKASDAGCGSSGDKAKELKW
jgi:radical S-adenosyl methionine domain-containing protein 2